MEMVNQLGEQVPAERAYRQMREALSVVPTEDLPAWLDAADTPLKVKAVMAEALSRLVSALVSEA